MSDLIDRAATAEAVEKLTLYDPDSFSRADSAESFRRRAVALIDNAPAAPSPALTREAQCTGYAGDPYCPKHGLLLGCRECAK
jgi:hypothetical protein